MATCKLCGRGGLLFRVNKYGLCSTCYAGAALEAKSNLRVINESNEIIKKSKNLSTRLSRCDTVEECARRLLKYEDLGITITEPPPSEIIRTVADWRQGVVVEACESVLSEANAKAAVLDDPKAKAKHFSAGLLRVTEYSEKLGSIPDRVSKIQSSLRTAGRKATLDAILDDARKAEFKGQTSKAIDKYKEALYLLKTDSVDDAFQKKDITQIEGKIAELEAAATKG